MAYKPKGRAEMLKRFNQMREKSRKPGFGGPAIILGARGGMTRKKILQVVDKLKLKRELHLGEKVPQLKSHHNVMLTKGAKVTATDLVTRFSLRYLMRPLERMRINPQQRRAFEKIILFRERKIKGTNIDLNLSVEFYLLELANSFEENGHEKALVLARKLTQRGNALREMTRKSNKEGDTFYNVPQKAGVIEQILENISPRELAMEVTALIKERSMELERLKQMKIPQKERYVKLIEEQIERAKQQQVKYMFNNF